MNVLKHFKKAALLTLLGNGISQHEIARKTRIDRKTIRKYQVQLESSGEISNSPMATGSAPRFSGSAAPGVVVSDHDLAPQGSGARTSATGAPRTVSSANGMRPTGSTSPSPVGVLGHGSPLCASPPGVFASSSASAPHHDWIVGEVAKGRNGVAIYQDLVELFGFKGRYNSVKRYVRKLRKKAPEQYDRLEFLPGEEAQVDYGQGAYTRDPKTGKRRRPRLFVMTLRYSRKSFRKVVWKSSQQVWAKLHEEAFRYFGGAPQYVVLDNLKEGVIKPDIYEPELNPVYAAVLVHYGVVADPARVADPDRKGTVENAIQHTQNTALKGREFETIEEQNQWLMHWEERWASLRVHGRTKRQVMEMFLEEKPYLKVLPMSGFKYFEQGIRTVWDDGCVEVYSAYYAALPAPLYSKVIVRIYDMEIEILDPQTLIIIRRHFKSSKRGSVRMEESDRIFNPSRKTQVFLDQAGQIGSRTKELCGVLFSEQGRLGQRRMRGILALTKNHPAALIEKAAGIALERRVRSSKTVRELVCRLKEKERDEKQISLLPALTQSHELIRKPSDYAMFWEQHTTPTKEECHADVDCRDREISQNAAFAGNPRHAGNQGPSGDSGGDVLHGHLLALTAGRDGPPEIKTD